MGHHGAAAIAHRLQKPDLAPLERDQPREGHVDEEGRHDEEDRRQHAAHGAKLLKLGIEEGVRDLIGAPMRAPPAVALEDGVEPVDDVARIRAGHEA